MIPPNGIKLLAYCTKPDPFTVNTFELAPRESAVVTKVVVPET